MFNFFKKLVGLPTADERKAAEAAARAPYKVEAKDQLPAVKLPSTGGIKAAKPRAPKKAAGKPKVKKAK